MRALFAADLIVAVVLFGTYMGVRHRDYTTGQLVLVSGLFGFLLFGLASQKKAERLRVPFDGYSVSGLVFVTVINIGLGWSLWERRPRKRA